MDSIITRHDGYFHAARLQTVASGFKDGQIIPQVFPDGANGFGYAYNIFYGPLVPYISVFFRAMRFSWPTVINLTYIFLLVFSGVVMCFVVSKISNNKVIAALSGILYLFAPYHLVNLYMRAAIGEFAALTFAPLLFLGLYCLVNRERCAIRYLAISMTAILLSHNLSLIIFAIVAVLFVVFYMKVLFNKHVLRSGILAVLLVIAASAFFLAPLLEAKLVGNYGIFDQEYVKTSFGANPNFLNKKRLGFSEIVWGKYDISDNSTINPSVGPIALFAIFAFPFVFAQIGRKGERKFILVLYILSLVMLLLTTKIVDWSFMPNLLLTMQFPWRFLGAFCVTITIVEGYVIYYLFAEAIPRRQCLYVILVGMIAACSTSALFFDHSSERRLLRDKMPINSDVTSGVAGWQAEYLPIQLLCDGAKGCGMKNAQRRMTERGKEIIILDGEASINNVERSGTKIDFMVEAKSDTSVELPLVFYPGYKATIHGATLKVVPSEKNGLVEVKVPSMVSGKLEVHYGLSIGTIIGGVVSGLTICTSGIVLILKRKR